MNWQNLLRPDIRAMDPYQPVVPLARISEQVGRPSDSFVKLDANENPYGPSPKAVAALAGIQDLHRYPDAESRRLRRALSVATGLPVDYLLTGAGADELIDLVTRAIVTPGDAVINCPPSFGMYPTSATINGATLIDAPRRADFSLDLPAIERAAAETRAKLLFLCSPNNPDGSVVDDATLVRLLQMPVLVLLDEAYVEFAPGTSRMTWAMEYENLVVLRTFSKVAGLAGLRVGYGAFPGWLLEQLWKIKQPYNVNVAAAVAAVAALEDRAWLEEKARLLAAERARITDLLGDLDFLRPCPSRSNFVLCRVIGRKARALKESLAGEGVLVRYFDKPFLEDCIRISAGRPADTDRLIEALKKVEA